MKAAGFPSWVFCLVLLGLIQVLVAADTDLQVPEKVIASAEVKYGQPARKRLVAWLTLIASNKGKPDAEKLKLANDFFNQTPFSPDMEHWGQRDYWATPVEMLASSGGDCEDYAIGKYFTLLALGINLSNLRITYVKAPTRGPADQAHMVLTYFVTPDAMPLVLDNLDKEIKSADARTDLIPVYSFNGDGLWLSKERNSGRAVGSSSRISLWTELNARMGKELK